MIMIINKLLEIESVVKTNIFNEQKKLISIKTFQVLLDQIDFDNEVVQIENLEKLTNLFISLKGRELIDEENELLERIIEK